MSLSIVVPIWNPKNIKKFVALNKEYLQQYPLIVIDSGGGEDLKQLAHYYIKEKMSLSEARRHGYTNTTTEFTLNLDCDVIIPKRYIEKAKEQLMQNTKIGAISLFIETPSHNMGILDFGCSIWRTNILKQLYDYNPQKFGKHVIQIAPSHYVIVGCPYCECSYMWRQLIVNGYKLDIVPEFMIAEHLKKE